MGGTSRDQFSKERLCLLKLSIGDNALRDYVWNVIKRPYQGGHVANVTEIRRKPKMPGCVIVCIGRDGVADVDIPFTRKWMKVA